jgi:hypothetical protein
MEDKNFQPELGHMAFGQAWEEYEASNLLIAALDAIDRELDRVMGNITQKSYPSPFSNTGNDFKCDVFEVDAYSWSDNEQPFNFKWKDVIVKWYKWLGRGTSVNQKLSNDKISEMLEDCLSAIQKYEKENDPFDF